MASLSMESMSALNSIQSIEAPSMFRVCLDAGDERAPRTRVLNTKAFRRPNMIKIFACGRRDVGGGRFGDARDFLWQRVNVSRREMRAQTIVAGKET